MDDAGRKPMWATSSTGRKTYCYFPPLNNLLKQCKDAGFTEIQRFASNYGPNNEIHYAVILQWQNHHS
jgi:hypothetical protein